MIEMERTIKVADMPSSIVTELFRMLNPGNVGIRVNAKEDCFVIVSKVSPEKLIYPEGWYYAKGCVRNTHNASNGFYSEIPLIKDSGEEWG